MRYLFLVQKLPALIILSVLIFLSACGDDDESTNGIFKVVTEENESTGGNPEDITVAYVENEITQDFYPPNSYTASNTVMVHDDGYQDNDIDIGRVILSKINSNATGETLAIAFSFKQSITPADGTFAAFYIDTDNDPLTGKPVEGIGADALFLDLHSFDPDGTSEIYDFSHFHIWSGTQWLSQGGTYSTASYYSGRSINTAVFASNSSSIPNLLGMTSVTGVFTVQLIPTGDPNRVSSTIDTTDTFSFDFPT